MFEAGEDDEGTGRTTERHGQAASMTVAITLSPGGRAAVCAARSPT
ncbi:hypothetical protein [Streptomyces sp. NPDC001508]